MVGPTFSKAHILAQLQNDIIERLCSVTAKHPSVMGSMVASFVNQQKGKNVFD